MIITHVKVKNFKSIETLNMTISKGCKIFVGTNESGKTNLLNALNTMDKTFILDNTYVKEGTGSQVDAYVQFDIILDENEKLKIQEELFNYLKNKANLNKIFQRDNKNIDIFQFLNFNFSYKISIRANKREFLYCDYEENNKYELNSKYFYIFADNNNPINIINKSNNEVLTLTSNRFIDLEEFDFENQDQNKDGNLKEIYEDLENKIIEIITNNNLLPNILFWEYSDKYLLPSEVITEDFITTPSICIPLENMFKLAGISNIREEYSDKKKMGEASFQNLLNKVCKETNNYLKEVWKSMPKNVNIAITEVGEKLRIRINDSENTFLASKRSDGFKRIITFMIMLSINNKNNSLKDTLILIDEPDIQIDILGQEYLRDELINIGKNNYVFFSTHSTNMIDRNNIDRHILVKKESESTIIEEANEENYTDIETLYRALGMNVYKVINENNLIFEGWFDEKVYKLFLGKSSTAFKNIGFTHLSGITKAKVYAEFWGLLSRNYYIISDADTTALNMKEDFITNKYEGKWITYDDLVKRKIKTLEDFLKPEYIKKIADQYSKSKKFKNDINLESLQSSEDFNIDVIETWIKSNVNLSYLKETEKDFKNELYENISKRCITDNYKEFLENLKKTIFCK